VQALFVVVIAIVLVDIAILPQSSALHLNVLKLKRLPSIQTVTRSSAKLMLTVLADFVIPAQITVPCQFAFLLHKPLQSHISIAMEIYAYRIVIALLTIAMRAIFVILKNARLP
jgi:hypothetical protein